MITTEAMIAPVQEEKKAVPANDYADM
jgi:hypothetical protein